MRDNIADSFRSWYRKTRIRRIREQFKDQPVKNVFSTIYRQNYWGGRKGEFYSGTGSDQQYAQKYSENVKKFVEENNILSIVDLGCGDFRIGRLLTGSKVHYTGIDIVEELVQRNQREYGDENTEFLCRDIIKDRLPPGDLCCIRQVFQHLSNDQIMEVLDNCTHYKFVIVTEHIPKETDCIPNIDKPHGPDTRIHDKSGVFLEFPPFNRKIELLHEMQYAGPESGKMRIILMRNF